MQNESHVGANDHQERPQIDKDTHKMHLQSRPPKVDEKVLKTVRPEPQQVCFRERGVSIFTNSTDLQKVTNMSAKGLENKSQMEPTRPKKTALAREREARSKD